MDAMKQAAQIGYQVPKLQFLRLRALPNAAVKKGGPGRLFEVGLSGLMTYKTAKAALFFVIVLVALPASLGMLLGCAATGRARAAAAAAACRTATAAA